MALDDGYNQGGTVTTTKREVTQKIKKTNFTIDIELEDERYCNGCPCLNTSTIYGNDCDYYNFGGWGKEDLMQETGAEPHIIRPDICKANHKGGKSE